MVIIIALFIESKLKQGSIFILRILALIFQKANS